MLAIATKTAITLPKSKIPGISLVKNVSVLYLKWVIGKICFDDVTEELLLCTCCFRGKTHSHSSKAEVMWSAITADQKIKNEPLSLHWRRLVGHADLQDSVEPTPVRGPLILTRSRINACVRFAVSGVSSDYQRHIKMKHAEINIGLPALWFSTWVCCRGETEVSKSIARLQLVWILKMCILPFLPAFKGWFTQKLMPIYHPPFCEFLHRWHFQFPVTILEFRRQKKFHSIDACGGVVSSKFILMHNAAPAKWLQWIFGLKPRC